MNLYQALQGVLDKVRQNNESVLYATDDKEMIRAVLDNQERLAESLMVMGGLLQAILAKDVEVEIVPPKGSMQN